MKVTVQATYLGALAWVPAHGCGVAEHWLRVPSGACPVSRNPLLGVARLRYRPSGRVLEVVALQEHLRGLVRPGEGHPRSVEQLAARLAADAGATVGVPVEVDLWLLVRPMQLLRVRC